MLPFRVTTPATVPQSSEIPEELMNYHVIRPVINWLDTRISVTCLGKKSLVGRHKFFKILTLFKVLLQIALFGSRIKN
jgi:hypothetical protein